MGRSTMIKLEKIRKDEDCSQKNCSQKSVAKKTKLVCSFVFPVVTYGSESWIQRKVDQRRLNAFEMRTWRRLMRILWSAKKRHDLVLEQLQPHMPLLNIINKVLRTHFVN